MRREGARRSRRRLWEASARSPGPHGRRGRQRRWWGSRDQGVPKLGAVSFNSNDMNPSRASACRLQAESPRISGVNDILVLFTFIYIL